MTGSGMPDSLSELAQQLDEFAKERRWQQFHSPKNLASTLLVEAGELRESARQYIAQNLATCTASPVECPEHLVHQSN